MNRDASIDKDNDWMGFGMVLGHEQGLFLAASSQTLVGRLDVLQAEAKAAIAAIQFCKRLGFSQIHLEGVA
jgi:hypothetical protein